MIRLIYTVMIILVVILIASNVFSQNHDCAYTNYTGSFTFEEKNFNNRNFSMCIKKFDEFKRINKADTILYRICEKSGKHFWDYSDYLVKEKYKLPFIKWDEVKQRRGNVENKTGFQDF